MSDEKNVQSASSPQPVPPVETASPAHPVSPMPNGFSQAVEPPKPEKKPRASLGKIAIFLAALVLFLLVTNPRLIPFLPSAAKEAAGSTWESLFGDVDSVVSVLQFNWATIFKLIAVVLFLFLVTSIVDFILQHLKPKTRRGRSVVTLLQSALHWISVLVGVFWGLSAIGLNLGMVVASLGLVAVIIGFGANQLVSDCVTGIFLLFENQFNVGDVIEVGGFRGTIDRIGIRTTNIRDSAQNIKIVNNSQIRDVLNRSLSAKWVNVTLEIPYDENLWYAEDKLVEALPKIAAKYPAKFRSVPVYMGVTKVTGSAVELMIAAEVAEEDIYRVPRILNRELKLLLDEAGVARAGRPVDPAHKDYVSPRQGARK